MHKTVQTTCFTHASYVTAFGFVGCILFFMVLNMTSMALNMIFDLIDFDDFGRVSLSQKPFPTTEPDFHDFEAKSFKKKT